MKSTNCTVTKKRQTTEHIYMIFHSNIVVRAILVILIGNQYALNDKHIWMDIGNFFDN